MVYEIVYLFGKAIGMCSNDSHITIISLFLVFGCVLIDSEMKYILLTICRGSRILPNMGCGQTVLVDVEARSRHRATMSIK